MTRTRFLVAATVAASLVLGGCAQALKPPPPEVYAEAEPGFDQLASELRTVDADILFVTNRVKEVDGYGQEVYGTTRSPSLGFGSAVVRLQVGEGWDDLVAWTESRPGAPPGKLSAELVSVNEMARFPATPYLFELDETGKPRLDPEVQREVETLDRQAQAVIRERLSRTSAKQVDIFVHGIRTQFDEFLVAVAETWHIAGRQSVPIAFSWPAGAGGLLSAYARDRESGEFSVPHLKQTIETIAKIPEVERINLFAHSRGSDVVMTSVRELFIRARAAGVDAREQYKIANIVLVAPDLDLEVAEQRFGDGAGSGVRRITIYANAEDTAIGASSSLFSSRARLGQLEREALDERQLRMIRRATNLDIVIYTGAGGGTFSHSYYRTPAVAADMILLVRDDREPGAENGRPLEPLGNHFWKVGDEYLR